MTTKICKKCNETKELTQFSLSASNKGGRATLCKPCVVLRNTEYWRTPKGRISQLFNVQKVTSKARGHTAPGYTAIELYNWAMKHGLEAAVVTWANSGYAKDLSPSIDRLDVTQGYAFGNIRLVTWKENNDAQYEDRKSCKVVTKQNRAVRQLALDGSFIAEHKSIAAAARATGAVRSNINAMCTGASQTIKSVGGFLWEYAKEKQAA